jgi:hypothetical protein
MILIWQCMVASNQVLLIHKCTIWCLHTVTTVFEFAIPVLQMQKQVCPKHPAHTWYFEKSADVGTLGTYVCCVNCHDWSVLLHTT